MSFCRSSILGHTKVLEFCSPLIKFFQANLHFQAKRSMQISNKIPRFTLNIPIDLSFLRIVDLIDSNTVSSVLNKKNPQKIAFLKNILHEIFYFTILSTTFQIMYIINYRISLIYRDKRVKCSIIIIH